MMMRAKWQGFARETRERLPVCESYLCLSLISLCKYLHSSWAGEAMRDSRCQLGREGAANEISAVC